MHPARIARRVVKHARERGVVPVVTACASWGSRWALGQAKVGRTTDSFRLDGRDVPYLYHRYNSTWLNERAVEVPLTAAVLAEAGPSARVLEIGNVMAHYQPIQHTVVDRYEQAPGVLNVDVVDIDLPGPFDLIVAVSTLEHVGFDEDVRDPDKPARAIAHLTSLLAPGGRLWITIPVGYNPDLDRGARDGSLGFTRLSALRRTGPDNRWEQIPLDDVWGITYDWLLYTAHAIVVAELVRPAVADQG
jgi:SAM-dependent methyltransferase